MPADLKELLRVLNGHGVKFLVVGRIAVISREDLIPNKIASGREQDLLDVKKLRASDSQR
jgi:hypothetical protein